jgi:Trk K+ transport system NAD-binding subunit
MKGPIVLCGLGRTGARVLTYLRAAGLPVVVIDNRCRPDDRRLHGARLVAGDCRDPETLEAAAVAGASGVLVLTNDDLVNISTTLQIRALDPEVRIIVRLFDENLLPRLGQSVHNVFALSTAMLTAPVLALTAMTGAAIGAFHTCDGADGARLVAEAIVTPQDHLHGRSIGEALEERGAACLAHLPLAQADRVLGEVDPRLHLQPGDLVVVCGPPRALAPILAGVDPAAVPDLRWASYLYRLGRMAWRTLAEMDLAVLVCTSVLIAVVVSSTIVLHTGVTRFSLPDALLRTVSIMATSADMHDQDYADMPRMRVFVSFLRIIGAVLLAAFTAIVTNYLLRARLGGVFEVRRIPESGHVIVCGLGSIGFLSVKELMEQGERVVAIERDLSNPFITAARRLGAAVLLGDATLPEVQKQAKMTSAHSVIAATSNDLSNLSIALLAREGNRSQRVVVLLSEPKMARMLRQAAGVELALSVPALAAPAFLAALYGNRVLTVVMVRQHLLAVLDLMVREGDPLAGQAPDEAARVFGFRPLGRLPACENPGRPLAAGDRLVVAVPLPEVEALLGRQPAARAGS